MNETQSGPNYSRKQAVSLICTCYNEFGSELKSETMQGSVLENSLGEVPESWNVGLFRFLDEVIYLFNILNLFGAAATGSDASLRSQMILCYQIEKSLLAVRVLCAVGLDASARQNTRSLYEMCHALCRCLVDPEFMRNFANQPTLKSTNEFWHRFMSKQRTESFLRKYNETADQKCLLVLGDDYGRMYEVLGFGAHPNYLGWKVDWADNFSDPENLYSMFSFGAHRASEFVLSTACHLSLATLNFASSRIADISSHLGLLNEHPAFQHYENDIEALHGLSKTSGLMILMLATWTNRNKSNFNPEVHF